MYQWKQRVTTHKIKGQPQVLSPSTSFETRSLLGFTIVYNGLAGLRASEESACLCLAWLHQKLGLQMHAYACLELYRVLAIQTVWQVFRLSAY